MSHSPHPTIQIHGLADNCARCAEYADDPWRLEDSNLARLAERVQDGESPRSANEALAMSKVRLVLAQMMVLNRLGIEVPA